MSSNEKTLSVGGKTGFSDVLKKMHRSRYLYMLFLFPFLYYVIFHYWPMYGIIIAFKDYNIVTGIMKSPWIGLENFNKFLLDPYFWKLVRNTLLLNIYGMIWGFPMPILLALLLNEVKHPIFKKFIQTSSYLPHFISTVVVCGMIVNLFSTNGAVNQLLGTIGIKKIPFLMLPQWFRPIFIGSSIWQSTGFGSIIYLAAIAGINPELYEAATIDGANRYRQMVHVTLPSLAPTISILLIMNLGRLLTVGYEKIILLYNGATYETADVIATYVYRRGLLSSDFSYATAVGLFSSVIGLVLLYIANLASRKIGEVSLW